MKMKVVALVSGGKDSCYAMLKCADYGHEIVALANLMPFDESTDDLDSYMYQTAGHQIISSYAECMGLPLFRRRIRGCSRRQSLSYMVTPGDEVEDMVILLNEVKRQIPSVTAVSSGAIASDYQRLRVENVCSRLGLVSLAYLWKLDQSFLLQEMITRGIKAIIVKVASLGLSPEKHLNRDLASMQDELNNLKKKYAINVCGEGGEYETLTLDCPLFTNARISLDDYEIILHSHDSIAPVGILRPLVFRLEHKELTSPTNYSTAVSGIEMVESLYEGQGDNELGGVSCLLPLVSDCVISANSEVHFSMTKHNIFSICCWIQDSSEIATDLYGDLTVILHSLESKLEEGGLSWANVLYVNMYIANMNEFALANEIYMAFITDKKCHLGVPSRSTVELPLPQAGLGKAYIEILVTEDHTKRVLHVQSISCWAPSCIGPYSQATLHKGILYMAGQLGLDPPTMMLCRGGAVTEMKQALENCEAVANCFGCSVATCSILIVIYCSASVSCAERAEMQTILKYFLCSKFPFVSKKSSDELKPINIYVLSTNLPKSALVEVKPVLHGPMKKESCSDMLQLAECAEVMKICGFEQIRGQNCSTKIYTIDGKICFAVVHIADKTVSEIYSQGEQVSTNTHIFATEKDKKEIASVCISLLDKILQNKNFFWEEVVSWRIYYRTSHLLSADVLMPIFLEAVNDFTRASCRIKGSRNPIFNLIPVLASGGDASMQDLLTCELFASKI